jgi:glycosyltransferase involved in cell wall biosynthesis
MQNLKIVFFPIGKHDTAGNKRLKNLSKYLKKMENIKIYFFNPSGEKSDKLSGIFFYLQKIFYKFLDVFRIPLILFREREKGHQNILYFYEGRHLMLHRILLAKLLGYKILIDIVENPNSLEYSNSKMQTIRTLYFLFLYRIISFYANAIIVVSTLLKSKIENDFGGRIRVFLLAVSYDPDDFKVELQPYSYPTIFYGGSYGSNYDFESFFHAFNKISNEFPQLKLCLSGKMESSMEKKILDSIDNKNQVIFFGFLDEVSYFRTICSMSILCMPRNNTIQANAGFPFKLAEYLASGKPVITSRSSDVSDYVDDNDAYIYEPGDSLKIESMIRQILNDYETALKIGNNGMLKAQKYFDSQKNATEFYSFLINLNS